MLARGDETDILLIDVVTGHADDEDGIWILRGVRDDDPEVPVGHRVREVERVSGLHDSGPEDGVQVALELVLLLHGLDHVGPPLGLQRLFPGDRRGCVRDEVLLPLGEFVRLAADVPLGIVLVSLRDLLQLLDLGLVQLAATGRLATRPNGATCG